MQNVKRPRLRIRRDPYEQAVKVTAAIRTACRAGMTIEVHRCGRAGTTTVLRFAEHMKAARQIAMAKLLEAVGFTLTPDAAAWTHCTCGQCVLTF